MCGLPSRLFARAEPHGRSQPRVHARGLLAFGLGAVVLVASMQAGSFGCAGRSRPRARTEPAQRLPADFWLEIDVVPGRSVSDRARVEERRARFVLLPDGSLHGETDVRGVEGARPPRVRTLSREQVAEVWQVLSNAGFTSRRLADTGGRVVSPEPRPGEIVATLELHADGERFAFMRRYAPGGDDEAALRTVVRTVAALGWASDEALAETAELPLRYDLGPDPYARFSRDAGNAEGSK